MKVLAADVGGTHFTMAAVHLPSMKLLQVSRSRTKTVSSVEKHVTSFLTECQENGHDLRHACFAVAGPVNDRRATLTNAPLSFDADTLKKKTSLTDVKLINDFEAIGYAVNTLEPGETKSVQKGKPRQGPVAIVGAGTGLGKAFVFDSLVRAGEGAHTPLPAENDEELHLITFLKHKKLLPVYQDVLSGRGLENLYEFFAHKPDAAERIISGKDAHARDAVRLFKKYYARFAKTAALDVLASAVYIAGGIAAKNTQLFDKAFLNEFNKAKGEHAALLSTTPITIITNYEVSLRGAAKAIEVSA